MDYLKGNFAKQFDFNVEEILSCSLDSTVYETKYAGQTAAMKCIQRSPELRDIQSPLIKETLQKHTQLDHPNIIKHICIQEYLTSMAEERTVYRVFLEFCKGGTLTQALKKGVLTPQLLQKWSRNIVDGVAYLHKENYLHGNLNGDNILLSSTDSSTTIAKISGLASTKHLLVKFAESKGTSAVYDNPDSLFMSPEMINGRHEVEMENGQLELRTDIWSVGCLVIQMANGGFVEFHKEECGKVIKICDLQAKFIGSGGFPTVSSTLPDVVKDFVHKCFRHHPSDRPSAADLQIHDFLTCNENEAVKWHLPVIPVQIVNVINRGAEGTVYEARRKDTNETVAIKCITLGNLHPDRKLELLRTKAEIAMALDHPNIVRHIHDQEYPLIQSLEREYQIMMEYCGEHVIIPIQLVKMLASGPQGKVFEGLRTDNQETIAVKCILLDLDSKTRAAQIRLLRSRCAMMITLTHPHVVRHLHAQEIPVSHTYDVPVYQIIMELCAGPTLHDLVRKVAVTPLLLQKWTRQIVEGIRYLHERGFVHRDIKGANMMMSSNDLDNCQVKIADLGDLHCLKKYATESMEVSHEKGTWAFMSPEMITGRQGHDEALDGTYTLGRRTDIWSLGCVVIEMLNGGFPSFYKNGVKVNGDMAVMYFVGTGGMPTIPQNLPREVDDFIKKCLQRRPYDRPSAGELVQHEFLNAEESRVALWKLPPRPS